MQATYSYSVSITAGPEGKKFCKRKYRFLFNLALMELSSGEWDIFLVLCRHLLLNFVEALYCQNRNTTELDILREDRYWLHVGHPGKKVV